ncbi:MAG: hypothetical protein KZQ65_08845, partial [Candidatus Thiodiazotropha sp. (ex Gloverina cf. vestifex)]|nr:hypothetical protein [Candidatus Thiodiazotropha sp. (ex Gloverina cf. vestifex)]
MSTRLPITACCFLSLILLNACNREVSESTLNNSSTFSSDEQEVIHQLQQACRYLVKDFGTSESPKSTRQRDSRYAPT